MVNRQLWCFWLKWTHDVNCSPGHQKSLITVVARSWSYCLTRYLKISVFDQDLQVVQELQRGPGLCPKKEAPQTDVYNLSPYGIFLQACSSLNHLPGSQSWVSNCLIKLFFKIHWQVQKCRSLWYTHFPNPLMSSPFIFLCFLVLSCLFFSLALGSAE